MPHSNPDYSQFTLQQRVSSYIKALDVNDLSTIYDMIYPDCKKDVDKTEFIQRSNMKYTSSVVDSIEYINDDKTSAMVVLNSSIKTMGYKFQNYKTKNKWIKLNNCWYIWMNLSKESKL